MIAGHRWEYQHDYLGYKCVILPIGGVESHQWCVGCGCFIGDEERHKSKLFFDDSLELSLDTIAISKGYQPIESGTIAEVNFNIRRSKCLIEYSH